MDTIVTQGMAKPSPRSYDDALTAAARVGGERSQPLRDLILPGLLAIQLLLYFFWQVTQFEAVNGTWYAALFHKSGPVLLPIIFGIELVLFALALPLAWEARRSLWQSWPVRLLGIAVLAGLLTTPLAYLHHFESVKIWKDVAFLLGYLTVPLVLLLRRDIARGFFFYYIALAFVAGIAELVEAEHRALMAGQSPGQFLLTTYRIFGGGGQLSELLLLFGLLAILASHPRRFKQVLFAVLLVLEVYFFARQRLDWTRLTWISLALALPVIVLFLLPGGRVRKAAVALVAAMAAIFLLMTPLIGALANNTDLASRFKPSQDISVVYRVRESQILWHNVRSQPLTGWGPGGTISPHVPSEPTRNNTSSFFNGYLGIPYKFGIPVFLLILSSVISGILIIWQGLKRQLPMYDAAVAAGAGAFLIGVLTTSAASDILFANFSALPVGLMLGIGVRMVAQDRVTLAATRS
jgi:hypothetical protein